MADTGCPPLIVEGDWSPAQTKTVKNKLKLYFHSKKKSSGGDCRVEDGAQRAAVYFTSEEVRERVLARTSHEIALENQTVKLHLISASSLQGSDGASDTKSKSEWEMERAQLQTSYNNLTKERDQLQTSDINLVKERDQLQKRLQNMTKERIDLQRKLQDGENKVKKTLCRAAAVFLGLLFLLLLAGFIILYTKCKSDWEMEMAQLQTINNDLTKERDQLQTSDINQAKERDQLQTSYNDLVKERDQLQKRLQDMTKERNDLQRNLQVFFNLFIILILISCYMGSQHFSTKT